MGDASGSGYNNILESALTELDRVRDETDDSHWERVFAVIYDLVGKLDVQFSTPTWSDATASTAMEGGMWTEEAIHSVTTALTDVETRLSSVLGTIGLTAAQESAVVSKQQETVTAEYNAAVADAYAMQSARLPHSGTVGVELERLARRKESALRDIVREFVALTVQKTLEADQLYMQTLQKSEEIRLAIDEQYARRKDELTAGKANAVNQIAVENAKMQTDVALANAKGNLEATIAHITALINQGAAATGALSSAINSGADLDTRPLKAEIARLQAVASLISDIVAEITTIAG